VSTPAIPPEITAFARRHGLRLARARCIARLDCEVWRLWPESRAADAGRSLALRIYPPDKGSPDVVQVELSWLSALADQGLRVPRPLIDRDGQCLRTLGTGPPGSGRPAVLLSWVEGRCLDAGLRPLHLRRTGELIARLHHTADALQTASALPPPRPVDGPSLDHWAADQRPPGPGWPRTAQQLAVQAARALLAVQAHWPRGEPPPHQPAAAAPAFGLLHGDMHLWNLVHARGQAGAIDFTDCGWGWRLQDLASTLQYLQHPLAGFHDHRPAFPALRDALLAGYDSLRPLPAGWAAQLDALIALRWLNSAEWVLDCWPDLDHRPFGRAMLAQVPRVLRGWLKSLD